MGNTYKLYQKSNLLLVDYYKNCLYLHLFVLIFPISYKLTFKAASIQYDLITYGVVFVRTCAIIFKLFVFYNSVSIILFALPEKLKFLIWWRNDRNCNIWNLDLLLIYWKLYGTNFILFSKTELEWHILRL